MSMLQARYSSFTCSLLPELESSHPEAVADMLAFTSLMVRRRALRWISLPFEAFLELPRGLKEIFLIVCSNGKVSSAYSGSIKWEPQIATLTEGFVSYEQGAPLAASYAIAQAEVIMAVGQPFVSSAFASVAVNGLSYEAILHLLACSLPSSQKAYSTLPVPSRVVRRAYTTGVKSRLCGCRLYNKLCGSRSNGPRSDD